MTGGYQTYPEYCNSGVEWIGTMPRGWCVSRIKFFSQLNPSKQEVRGLPLETEVTFLPMEAIGEKGELDTSAYKSVGELINGYTYVGENDVLIAKITPCFENGKGAIACGLKNGVAFATTEVIPLRVTTPNNSKFLYYLLYCDPFRKIAEGTMYGAGGQKRVSDGFVANYHFAKPANTECETIANFLDHETAKIDTLIDKQQQLIKLLKEKRQAVISHAVTKGLNPDAPMKDSGVEWLGEVPEHWNVFKIKHLLKSEKGAIKTGPFGSQLKGEDMQGGDVKVINQRNVIDNDFLAGDFFVSNEKYGDLRSFKIYPDDILVTTRGTIGRTAIAPRNLTESILHPCLMRIQINQRSHSNKLISLIIQEVNYFLEQLKILSNATTIDVIYSENLKNVEISLPPALSEQEGILEHIFCEVEKINELIAKAEKAVSLMQERRTALISAAVTGKIDVRKWQSEQPKIPMEAKA
jgi:type I restriction enzyme S subunit